MKKLILFTPILALLSACGAFNPAGESNFACPGMPMGVVCKTPAAVYKSSMGELPQTDFDTPMDGTQASMDMAMEKSGKLPPAAQIISATTPSASPNIARPLREPAQVMRIWYAPWIDKNDGFNGASYKFVEVVSRKWSFGKPESSMGGVVVPYRDSTSVSNVVSNAVASVPKTGSIMSPQQPPQGNPMPQTQLQRNKQQAVSQGMPNSLPNFDLNSGVGLSAPNYSNVPSNPFN